MANDNKPENKRLFGEEITPYRQSLIDDLNNEIQAKCGDLDLHKFSPAILYMVRKFGMWGIVWDTYDTTIEARKKYKKKVQRLHAKKQMTYGK